MQTTPKSIPPSLSFPQHRLWDPWSDQTRFSSACRASWARPSFHFPIRCAIVQNDIRTLQHLLHLGADPNHSEFRGVSLLWLAAVHDRPNAVQLLLQHGADPNQRHERSGETAMHWAASEAVIRTLIDADANVNAQDNFGRTPLMNALVFHPREPDLIRAFLDAGADPSIRDRDGDTALWFARGRRRVSQVLRQAGARE